MCALTAVHLTANNSLGILNRNLSLCIVHPYDESNHQNKNDEYYNGKYVECSIL